MLILKKIIFVANCHFIEMNRLNHSKNKSDIIYLINMK